MQYFVVICYFLSMLLLICSDKQGHLQILWNYKALALAFSLQDLQLGNYYQQGKPVLDA